MSLSTQRALDLAIALPMLALGAPLIAILMLLVRLDSSGKALFSQIRVGRDGRPFKLYKIRTFRQDCHGIFPDEEIHWKDPRVTRLGRFLRRSRLDELPQLINIIRGEMSLIGPRPDIPIQVQRYTQRQFRRLTVSPGLTGLAQISGNTSLSWPQRIELDLWYIDNRSLSLYFAILWHTIPVVIRGEDSGDDPLGVRSRILTAAHSQLNETEVGQPPR